MLRVMLLILLVMLLLMMLLMLRRQVSHQQEWKRARPAIGRVLRLHQGLRLGLRLWLWWGLHGGFVRRRRSIHFGYDGWINGTRSAQIHKERYHIASGNDQGGKGEWIEATHFIPRDLALRDVAKGPQ